MGIIESKTNTLSTLLRLIFCLLGPNQPAQVQRQLEKNNFAYSKFRYDAFQLVNNKGTGQTVRMRRLVCTFVVRIQRQVFWRQGITSLFKHVFMSI